MKDKYRLGDKELVRRLDLLLQDMCKQYCARLNHSKRKYAEVMGDEGDTLEDNAVADVMASSIHPASSIQLAWKKAVMLYVVDPEVDPTPAGGAGHPKVGDKYEWVGDIEISIIYEPTLSDL